MQLDPRLLEILACPVCHSPLRAEEGGEHGDELVCTSSSCGLAYPVRDDIPVLLVDEAPGTRERRWAADRRRPSSTTSPLLERLDAAEMLRAVATAGAQVREALLHVEVEALARGRRRTAARGRSSSPAWAARASRPTWPRRWPAAAAPSPCCPARGHRLPGWVGAAGPGASPCPARAAPRRRCPPLDEALRRGARVVTVGAAGSPLAARSEGGRALHLPVDAHGADAAGEPLGAGGPGAHGRSTRSAWPTCRATCWTASPTQLDRAGRALRAGGREPGQPGQVAGPRAGRFAAVRVGRQRRRERRGRAHRRPAGRERRSTPPSTVR